MLFVESILIQMNCLVLIIGICMIIEWIIFEKENK